MSLAEQILNRVNSIYEEDINKTLSVDMFLISIIDARYPCAECKLVLEDINQIIKDFDLIKNDKVRWLIDLDGANSPIANKLYIGAFPIHLICRNTGEIYDVITGFPSKSELMELLT